MTNRENELWKLSNDAKILPICLYVVMPQVMCPWNYKRICPRFKVLFSLKITSNWLRHENIWFNWFFISFCRFFSGWHGTCANQLQRAEGLSKTCLPKFVKWRRNIDNLPCGIASQEIRQTTPKFRQFTSPCMVESQFLEILHQINL